MKNIVFDINKTPVSAVTIEQESNLAERMVKVGTWIVWLLSFLSIFVAVYTFNDLYHRNITQNIQFKDIYSLLLELLIVFVLVSFAGMSTSWRNDWRVTRLLLSVINKCDAERALDLCKKHHEIEAYRKAVVQEIQLVNGDLLAMMKFDEDQDRLAKERALHIQQEAAFETLHNI